MKKCILGTRKSINGSPWYEMPKCSNNQSLRHSLEALILKVLWYIAFKRDGTHIPHGCTQSCRTHTYHGCFAMESELLYANQSGTLFPILAIYNKIIPLGFPGEINHINQLTVTLLSLWFQSHLAT